MEKKSKQIPTYLTEEELEKVKAKANAEKRPLSNYIRKKILEETKAK